MKDPSARYERYFFPLSLKFSLSISGPTIRLKKAIGIPCEWPALIRNLPRGGAYDPPLEVRIDGEAENESADAGDKYHDAARQNIYPSVFDIVPPIFRI